MRKLADLLRGLVADDVLPRFGVEDAAGVCEDSRRVVSGSVFVAVCGTSADGRLFIQDALNRGARLVLGEGLAPSADGRVLPVADARAALATLAARWFDLADAAATGIRLIGVTGTNGKSTTVFMTRAILAADGRKCGLLGTVQYDLCGRTVKANMTTPAAVDLAGYVRECADHGATDAVMEVSSHALDQKRTDGLRFAAAGFTNLTGDHLDYHKSMERYGEAKRRLFERLDGDAVAVVNRDDANWQSLVRGCRARVVTYSLTSGDIVGAVTRNTIRGTHYRLRIDGTDLLLENALPGLHNVYNALAAAGLARAVGASHEAIERGLSGVRNIPGRLQRVPCAGGADVFVDYAHTDDALVNVLGTLRPLTSRRLFVVFGCGGDRDPTKRPRMARAAARFADRIVVTSDNPRSERPEAIIDDILSGFDDEARARLRVDVERRSAIRAALSEASDGDVVLIAGKGHEDYQILGSQRVHFDDVEVAIQAAAELAGARA